jgi:putative GTP pyrophosphokinase
MKDSQEHLVDEAALRSDYERSLPGWHELEQEAAFVLDRALKNDKINIHSLAHRVKAFPSFVDKCKRIKLQNPVREMQDMVGLRVVCLYLSDIKRVLQIVKREFDYLREADTISGGDVSNFGYMSHHVVVQMKSVYKGPRYDAILGKLIEIQIRTILMDAWANVSHHLQYKNESDVPSELLRDFHALSGLFYVADTHFELFFHSTQQARQKIDEVFRTTEPQHIEEEINLDTLKAYLATKFADREQPPSEDLSDLVSQLKNSKYKTIGQVDEDFERVKATLLEREHEVIVEYKEMEEDQWGHLSPETQESLKKGDKFYAAVGMIRVGLMMLSPEFAKACLDSWQLDEKSRVNMSQFYEKYQQRFK